MTIKLKKIEAPKMDTPRQVCLSEETMRNRLKKIKERMAKEEIDYLVVYCDLEHGSNFEYLTGFLTRFEESLLIIGKDKNYFVAGNENVGKASISRIQMEGILYSPFSLPNQPDMSNISLVEIFENIGMKNKKIGLCGWKLLNNGFDLPSFIIDELRLVSSNLVNATGLFINPNDGARIINNANEIAHYAYGSFLASKAILQSMEDVKVGIKELELASKLNMEGQRNSVVTICATGKRFENANLYPSDKRLLLGDPISITCGYKGGLQSRSAFVAKDESEISENNKNYLEKICIPYYNAIIRWLEEIKIGMSGDDLYKLVDEQLPKAKYNWKLNPGHLCADEEWLSSPVWKDSKSILQSGMIIQFDIIPSVKGLNGVGCEGGVVLADYKLKKSIKEEYPDLYEDFMYREEYLSKQLGIKISEDVLLMGNACGYYKPFLLSDTALVKENTQNENKS